MLQYAWETGLGKQGSVVQYRRRYMVGYTAVNIFGRVSRATTSYQWVRSVALTTEAIYISIFYSLVRVSRLYSRPGLKIEISWSNSVQAASISSGRHALLVSDLLEVGGSYTQAFNQAMWLNLVRQILKCCWLYRYQLSLNSQWRIWHVWAGCLTRWIYPSSLMLLHKVVLLCSWFALHVAVRHRNVYI